MMRSRFSRSFLLIALSCALVPPVAGLVSPVAAQIQTPEEFAGFRMGAEGKMVKWPKIVEYFRLVDRASDRVVVEELGKSTNGNPFLLAIISAPENLERLEEIKATQKRLAYPYELSEQEAERIARSSPGVLLITLNIHSTEVASAQMSLELVHRMATEESAFMQNILDNVVFLLVPSFNPDGQIMVTEWYDRVKGTEHELAAFSMPWLYHPYVGHDNNRDAFMLTQVESRHVVRVLYQEWFPQVYLDEHQMGFTQARMFVPPFRNPINPNVDPLVWAENGLLGFAMFTALNEAGKEGVTYDQYYTSWWQGAFLHSAWWHNMSGLLTEVASTLIASTVEHEKGKLGEKAERRMSYEEFFKKLEEDPQAPWPAPVDTIPRNNHPRPWLGGEWTLRDIVDYELVATYGLLEAVANNRSVLIENQVKMGKNTIEKGKNGDFPYAWVFPPEQHDPGALYTLLEALHFAGVEVHRAEEAFQAADREYPAGSFVILLGQPFGRYAKDLLEVQHHPDPSKMPPGAMRDEPYDVTGWTLPLQMGVTAEKIEEAFEAELRKVERLRPPRGDLVSYRGGDGRAFVLDPHPNQKATLTNRLLERGAEVSWLTREITLASGSTYPTGSLYVEGVSAGELRPMVEQLGLQGEETGRGDTAVATAAKLRLRAPRIGLYQPWTASMDEGWTRWLLEQYEFPYTTLHNADVRAGNLGEKFDAIILPGDRDKKDVLEGNQRKWTPEKYKGGIGEEGLAALEEFVRQGGTLVLLDESTEVALESWPVPLKNALKGLKREEFSCPGSLLKVLVDTNHPVAYGMRPASTAVFVDSLAYDLAPGFSYTDLKVIARYPSTNPLESGWIRGDEHLHNRIAAAEVKYEDGRIVLLGFRPQFRAQPHSTFKLLFNSLHYAAAEEP